MCYGDDARPPYPPVSGGSGEECRGKGRPHAAIRRRHRVHGVRGAGGRAEWDRRGGAARYPWAAYPSIRNWRIASPRLGSMRLRSITSGAPPRQKTATSRSRSARTSIRPNRRRSRPTSPRRSPTALGGGRGGERVFTVGFCFGGGHSWRQSAAQPGLAGAIGFYGVPARVRDVIGQMRAPLLILVAGEDHTPVAEFEKFDGELTEAGVEHTMVVYEGAPHSYFDRTFEEHREASADSWRQMLSFMPSHKLQASSIWPSPQPLPQFGGGAFRCA